MGNGIACGDLVGVPGSERALSELGHRAERGLALGAGCEALAVGITAWALIPLRNRRWSRLSIAFAVAGRSLRARCAPGRPVSFALYREWFRLVASPYYGEGTGLRFDLASQASQPPKLLTDRLSTLPEQWGPNSRDWTVEL